MFRGVLAEVEAWTFMVIQHSFRRLVIGMEKMGQNSHGTLTPVTNAIIRQCAINQLIAGYNQAKSEAPLLSVQRWFEAKV